MSVNKMFAKYVSQNIMGMIGISLYILADTFFISKAQGADGITALNLVLPLYSLIFAIGSMIGVGSATRFKILRAKTDAQADTYLPMRYSGRVYAVCPLCWQAVYGLTGLWHCLGQMRGLLRSEPSIPGYLCCLRLFSCVIMCSMPL